MAMYSRDLFFWEFNIKKIMFLLWLLSYIIILIVPVHAHTCESATLIKHQNHSIIWAIKPHPENITYKNKVFCEARTVYKSCFFEWCQRSSFINYLLGRREISSFYFFFVKEILFSACDSLHAWMSELIFRCVLFSKSRLILAWAEVYAWYCMPHMMRSKTTIFSWPNSVS